MGIIHRTTTSERFRNLELFQGVLDALQREPWCLKWAYLFPSKTISPLVVPFSLFNAHWLPRFTPLDFRSFWHFFHLSLITSKHSTALNTQNPNIFTTYTAATRSKPPLFFTCYWSDLTLGLLMPSLRLVSSIGLDIGIYDRISKKNGILKWDRSFLFPHEK